MKYANGLTTKFSVHFMQSVKRTHKIIIRSSVGTSYDLDCDNVLTTQVYHTP
jgi:hypothetical protein